MKIMWRIPTYGDTIEPVRVVAETAHFVTEEIQSRHIEGLSSAPRVFTRRSKKDNYIFDTFSEAKSALIQRLQRRIEAAERALTEATKALGAVYVLEDPSKPTNRKRRVRRGT